jgi:DNA-binding response OmpR family regulator
MGSANRTCSPRRKGYPLPASAQKPVLLIDDDALQLRLRKMVLGGAGFKVAGANSAEMALTLLRESPQDRFAAIVTDHMLPGASGAEFVRHLRALNPVVPVIVITGLPNAEMEYAGLNVSFREKPCDPEELIRLVASVTQRTA